jgi:hypothetical protein
LLSKYNKDDIILQPKFILQSKFTCPWTGKKYRDMTYIADYQIGNIVIDIKGMKTEVFKIKEKLFRCKYQDLCLYVGKSKDLIEQCVL